MPFIELDYQLDTAAYFQALAHLPYAIWLDSCRAYQNRGRFDIMSAEPKTLLKTKNRLTHIHHNGLNHSSDESIFDLVKIELQKLPQLSFEIELPFSLGAMGYYGYDIGRQLEDLAESLARKHSLPDACIGIYEWSLVVDHEQQKTYLIGYDATKLTEIASLIKENPSPLNPFQLNTPFKADMTRAEYEQSFNTIRQHLIDGDCYQVNLCQRFSTSFSGSPLAAFLELRQKSPAPFAAYMTLDEGAILSLSPERFIQAKKTQVLTQPIKGTRARHHDPQLDQASAQALLASSKDHAENLMIVDLMRNDLSHSCKPGSIKVPKLFELQSFSNVHHLVSSIEAELASDQHPLDLLKKCFPGGSITGAPKISAMNIIEKTEKQPRSVYCGSLGYYSIDEQMDTNIAIRTLLCEGDRIYAYAGGGIVIDSDCEAEYQESLTKINNLLKAFHG
ncbi:MAG TPA: aminodeoxychorismate synthase component I [Coxiellaceae bacterium]|nr:aminodeoxychorismate synthase component I [Coxiellaceae bacterium]